MSEAASDPSESSRRRLAALLVLLLSLFAATPSATASAAPAHTKAVVADSEARSNGSVRDASKRSKAADLFVVLDSGPKIVTRLVYVRPTATPGTALISQSRATFRTEYNARAPPASLI